MNNAIFCVKILKNKNNSNLNSQPYKILEIKANFLTLSKKKLKNEFILVFQGKEKENFLNYYKESDKLIVEGILILSNKTVIKLIVKKFYLFK